MARTPACTPPGLVYHSSRRDQEQEPASSEPLVKPQEIEITPVRRQPEPSQSVMCEPDAQPDLFSDVGKFVLSEFLHTMMDKNSPSKRTPTVTLTRTTPQNKNQDVLPTNRYESNMNALLSSWKSQRL